MQTSGYADADADRIRTKNNMSPPWWGDIINTHEYANALICIFGYQIVGLCPSFCLVPILFIYVKYSPRYKQFTMATLLIQHFTVGCHGNGVISYK